MGFVVITGDVGTGKTTLINALLEELDPEIKRVHLSDPGSKISDLFYLIAKHLELSVKDTNKGTMLWALNEFMQNQLPENERVLLIIDEAQRLSPNMLEEIRLLSNIETARRRLFQIFLLGQEELNAKLAAPELRQLRQRIGLKYHLKPLNPADTGAYITHRLQVAGLVERPFRGYELFARNAVKAIYAFTKGYPRAINVVCESALVTAFARDLKRVTKGIINEVTRDMEASYPEKRAENHRSRAWIILCIILLVALVVLGYLKRETLYSAWHPDTRVKEPAVSSVPPSVKEETPREPDAAGRASSGAPAVNGAVSRDEQTSTSPPGEKETDQEVSREVFFDFDSSNLTSDASDTLREVVEFARQLSDVQIIIEGHSDNVGSQAANEFMSRRRAESVERWFQNHLDLGASHVVVKWWGSSKPKYSNEVRESREKNRRVEIIVRGRTPTDSTIGTSSKDH